MILFSKMQYFTINKFTVRCDIFRGFNHPMKSGLVRGVQDTSSRNATLLEHLQMAIKPTLLRDLGSLLQLLDSNNE